MVELWYGIVSAMLILYVVMDGFDLGAGSLHTLVGRTDAERRQVLAAIGPYWDGNEVWLLATGGALFVAFPAVLAAGLSGFYLAIFLVLWCLILRGASIEFRGHVREPLWRVFWDGTLALSSVLLAICFGAALGNLIRGLPLDEHGWFALALFTDFSGRPPIGILDWYTVSVGVFALLALGLHGATYLAWKTDGSVHERSQRLARPLAVGVGIGWPLVTAATVVANTSFFGSFAGRPAAWIAVAAAGLGLATAWRALGRRRHLLAFLGSCAFIGGLLAATAITMFPLMLRAVGGGPHSISAFAAGNDSAGLRAALGWWSIGFPLAVVYFVVVFRLHRGKALAAPDGEGY